MSNPTDTNQASEVLEAKLSTIIFARFYDIPDKQRSTIVKNLSKLIRNEKLKLLAEVRERAVTLPIHGGTDSYYATKHIQAVSIDVLNKLEAEL